LISKCQFLYIELAANTRAVMTIREHFVKNTRITESGLDPNPQLQYTANSRRQRVNIARLAGHCRGAVCPSVRHIPVFCPDE